jgi:hypothetical protein
MSHVVTLQAIGSSAASGTDAQYHSGAENASSFPSFKRMSATSHNASCCYRRTCGRTSVRDGRAPCRLTVVADAAMVVRWMVILSPVCDLTLCQTQVGSKGREVKII